MAWVTTGPINWCTSTLKRSKKSPTFALCWIVFPKLRLKVTCTRQEWKRSIQTMSICTTHLLKSWCTTVLTSSRGCVPSHQLAFQSDFSPTHCSRTLMSNKSTQQSTRKSERNSWISLRRLKELMKKLNKKRLMNQNMLWPVTNLTLIWRLLIWI